MIFNTLLLSKLKRWFWETPFVPTYKSSKTNPKGPLKVSVPKSEIFIVSYMLYIKVKAHDISQNTMSILEVEIMNASIQCPSYSIKRYQSHNDYEDIASYNFSVENLFARE